MTRARQASRDGDTHTLTVFTLDLQHGHIVDMRDNVSRAIAHVALGLDGLRFLASPVASVAIFVPCKRNVFLAAEG